MIVDCYDKTIIESMNWKFDIGSIFVDDKRNIIITSKKIVISDRMNKGKPTKENKKMYGYHCNVCNDDDWIYEQSLKNGCGCKLCAGKKVVRGVNDVATIRPDLLPYFENEEDAYTHTVGSNKKVLCHCICCSDKKEITINRLAKYGFGACSCSKALSYPEKFVNSLLKQLGVNYIRQLSKSTFDWCEKYLYDFYLVDYNAIIETHGLQHYSEHSFGLYIKTARTLKEEQINDKAKEKLAKQNGVSQYIVIDCRESSLSWIKKSIIESNLPQLLHFDENDINWIQCNKDALKNNIVEDVCKYWNEHQNEYISTQDLANIFNRDAGTISKYLKRGTEIGLCNYDPQKAFADSKKQKRISIDDVKSISEYWNKHYDEGITTQTLSSIFHLNRDAIMRYLKIGAEHGFCNYNAKIEHAKSVAKNGKASGKPVNVYKDGTLIHNFCSANEAAKQMSLIYKYSFQPSKVTDVCRRNRNHHRGFVFRYDVDDEFKNVLM